MPKFWWAFLFAQVILLSSLHSSDASQTLTSYTVNGTITTLGCNILNGTIMNQTTSMYPIQICHYDNSYFQIKELLPDAVCSQVITTWKDPSGHLFTFPNPCVGPQFTSPSVGNHTSSQVVEPPLKQMIYQGIAAESVTCSQGLVLMKSHSNLPACVTQDTAQKLVKRGWGTMVSPPSCPGGNLVNGKCISTSNTMQLCKGDTLIPYSYALPCLRPAPTCPNDMTFSNGVCTTTPPYVPPSPSTKCDPSTAACPSVVFAYPSCNGVFSGNICEPGSSPCPTGLQGDTFGTACNYSPPKCQTGYNVFMISEGSYSCQPTNPPPLSNATTYSVGQRVGVFTIAAINQYNVTGYYNNPYPVARPGLGAFTIMHVGDILNPTCDGSAPLVITAINYPNSITVSTGKPTSGSIGGCPICLSADAEIDTPEGKINVKDIKEGMVVWSADSSHNKIKSKIIMVNKVFVGNKHQVIDLKLDGGRELFVSPNHPTYDGRTIGSLKVREMYDGSTIKSADLILYKYQYTYDILPDSTTGDYFANSILVGSTLK